MDLHRTPIEIIPGIYQISLPLRDNPAGSINTYLIRGTDQTALIDTGWNDPEAHEEMVKQLKDIGVHMESISRIIYTHIHPDHFGLAGTIYHNYRTSLAIHREGKRFIEYRYYGRESFIKELGDWHLIHGGTKDNADAVIEMSTNYTNHVQPVMPDTLFEGGETINIDPFRFQVIWTPGHDNDHICLYENDRGILFSGDHILPDTNPHIGVHSEITFNPLSSYLQSLESLKHLQVHYVLPGHERAFNNLAQRIDILISYHQQLSENVLQQLQWAPKNAYEIASAINWMEGPTDWNSFTPLVQAGLVTKCLSCLKVLETEGKAAEKAGKNGMRIYKAT